jgi:hypothetical protein
MRANPDPNNAVALTQPERTIATIDAHRPQLRISVVDFLKMQARLGWVLAEESVCLVGSALNTAR